MNTELERDTWVTQTLRLVQALLGAVSPNFRMVALAKEINEWRLIFVLASESSEDRDEIDDIAIEFEALQDCPIELKVELVVSNQPIDWPSPPTAVVYRRREA